MPLYEYKCRDCGKVTEWLKMGSSDTPVCSSCGGKNLDKIPSASFSRSSGNSIYACDSGDCSLSGESGGDGCCSSSSYCCPSHK